MVVFLKHFDKAVEVDDEGLVFADGEGPNVGQLVSLVLSHFLGHTYL